MFINTFGNICYNFSQRLLVTLEIFTLQTRLIHSPFFVNFQLDPVSCKLPRLIGVNKFLLQKLKSAVSKVKLTVLNSAINFLPQNSCIICRASPFGPACKSITMAYNWTIYITLDMCLKCFLAYKLF